MSEEQKDHKLELANVTDPSNYTVGGIVARFQIHELHALHKKMIEFVCQHHKKVILVLGVSRVTDTKRNPLDFATRKAMIQKDFPNIVILPLLDERSNKVWSENLDNLLKIPFGRQKILLYGSRDSFIPYYEGKNETTELVTTSPLSGTEIRNEVSREIIESKHFRAGVIHANFAKLPVTYPTVDIAVYNDKGQLLLARKPNEDKFRFVGGFVDRTDGNFEIAARREFNEETTCSILNPKYMFSHQVDDWRYRNDESGIMTTLFLAPFFQGRPTPSDDIEQLEWFDIHKLTNYRFLHNNIMEEHVDMMIKLVSKIYKEELVSNLGEFYVEKEKMLDPDAVVKDTTFEIINYDEK